MTTRSAVLRLCIMVCAACAALGATELVVARLVGYPAYPPPRMIRLDDGLGSYSDMAWESPHARVWNVEGGGIIHEYNNIGLSGSDVRVTPASRYVFVLGDSYVEAQQVSPREAATSVFQRALDSAGEDLQVLNLGIRKSDPYVSWYRLKFFERSFHPSYVVLVMEQYYANWLSGYAQPLSFRIPASFGESVPATGLHAVVETLRKRSSLCNILTVGFYANDVLDLIQGPRRKGAEEPALRDRDEITDALRACLRRFRDEYGPRFMAVSIGRDPGSDSLMSEFCRTEGIAFGTDPAVSLPENHIAGRGHLNVQGNLELGTFLFETYRRHRSGR